jgi:lysophospholipase L1-like esterase
MAELRRARWWVKALFGGTVALVLLLLLEGLASVALAAREGRARLLHHREEAHCDHDPELGWMNRRSFHAPQLFGAGRPFTTNQRGFRGRREVTEGVPEGHRRVVFVGDSFTEGYGVGDDDCYPAILESLESRIEAVNMGLGGFGLDQMYLWYRRDGGSFRADLVVLACVAHDFERMGPEGDMGYPDPHLVLEAGVLQTRGVPIPRRFGAGVRVGTNSLVGSLALARLLRRLGPAPAPEPAHRSKAESPLVEVTEPPAWAELVLPVLAASRDLARERGARFAFAYLPTRYTITREPTFAYDLACRACAGLEVPFFDLHPVFAAIPAADFEDHFLDDGHYSPRGNRLVAERLLQAILASFPDLLP